MQMSKVENPKKIEANLGKDDDKPNDINDSDLEPKQRGLV
jgi:hypothetical protein